MGENESTASLKAIKQLRAEGISAELYPDATKLKKQMAYANAMAIPYVAIIGESELADGTATLKNMKSGEQQTLAIYKLAEAIRP